MSETKSSASFALLGLPEHLLSTLEQLGYQSPSAIQEQSIPPLLAGRDIIGQAQTGTGKTAAFALPILARLEPNVRQPQALVLTPTRELAIQVAAAFSTYGKQIRNLEILPIYGGQDMSGQLRKLRQGVQIIVGTPGRLLDHLQRKSLDLSAVKTLVLDEADEMLRMGFIDDVEAILSHTGADKQTLLFSATLPPKIKNIARSFLRDPLHIKVATETATVSAITQVHWRLNVREKLEALTKLLTVEDFDAMIIFARTRETTTMLAEKIAALGYACAALNGDINQSQREQTITRLKKGAINILVATDVAARGLDVERISHVVNYDIPHDPEAYIHRIGRTGRAGRSGRAILFVAPREQRMLKLIEQATRQNIIAARIPTQADIQAQKITRLKQDLQSASQASNAPFYDRLLEQLLGKNATDTPQQELVSFAKALLYLSHKDLREPQKSPAAKPAEKEQRERPAKTMRTENTHSGNAPRKASKKLLDESGNPIPMQLYRMEAGSDHQVERRDIVGAIANEADLESRYIGQIEIFPGYSTVELPEGMPKDILQHLKQVWIRSRKMQLSLAGAGGTRSGIGQQGANRKPLATKKPGGKKSSSKKPGAKPREDKKPRADKKPHGDSKKKTRRDSIPKAGPKAGKKPARAASKDTQPRSYSEAKVKQPSTRANDTDARVTKPRRKLHA